MANQYLSLSLFVVLLSFFIILNGVSDFEEMKFQPVLNSIALTFADRQIEERLQPSSTPSEDLSVKEGNTLDKIRGLFNAHISGFEARTNRLGTIMVIRMPTPRFERAIFEPILESDLDEGFLPTLVSLIQTRDTEQPYRMDVMLNVSDTPADMLSNTPVDLGTNVAKIASFSERLEELGVEKKLVSIGLQKGQAGFVDLYFRRYEAFDPTGNLTGIKTNAEGAP